MTERVVVYKSGLCYSSVCAVADAEPEEVERATNAAYPTGISSRWTVSDDETFASGEPNPCVCNVDATRRHWLLSC